MWAGNLYLGPFEITERESVIIFKSSSLQVTSDNMTRWLITKFRIFTISRIRGTSFNINPSTQFFLRFLLCSESMTVKLTEERKQELIACCKSVLRRSKCSIRKFAKIIGKMVAAEAGVEYAPAFFFFFFFYKPLEKNEII